MTPLSFIHRYQKPANAASDHTILLLHGTGGDETDLLPLGQQLAPGAGLLSPRGKVLEHGMPRFFRRLAEGVFDIADIKVRAAELAAFIPEAAHAYNFDPTKVIALGFSNGANIAAATLLLHPEALAGAILLRPMIPLTPSPLPNLNHRPVLISAGQVDPLTTTAQTKKLADLLTNSGASVTLSWQQASHNLVQTDFTTMTQWLNQQGITKSS